MEAVVGSTAVAIKDLHFDSRKVELNDVFVAVRGTISDGHQFINTAVNQGAIAVICEELPEKLVNGVTYVQVDNSQKSLAYMAANFYDNPSENLKQLRNQIVEADGYMPITPEYNHSTSAAMKNTLDYFLEEYYFKPSAIVSYSVGGFGGVNAVQHLRLIFSELVAPSISSSFSISKVQDVFEDDGKLRDQLYEKRVVRFIEEFEWYIEAFKNQRVKGTPY